MSNIPAEHWLKRSAVELVANDRTSVLFKPEGDNLVLSIEPPDGEFSAPIEIRSDMAEILAEAIFAWQGNKLTRR